MRPMTRLSMFVLVGMLCAVPAAAQFQSVGSLEFRTSTKSAEAQQHFLRGVAILHSFGWKQAIEQFQAAQGLDPDFVRSPTGEKRSVTTTGIVKLSLTAVSDAQHGGFATGWGPVSWG